MYYFYYGNTCDIWVAAIFDTVQKEDGYYKNVFPLEAKVYRIVVSIILLYEHVLMKLLYNVLTYKSNLKSKSKFWQRRNEIEDAQRNVSHDELYESF